MDYNKPFDQTNPAAGYVNGNPATNTAGSIPCAEGLEYPQREIVALIAAAQAMGLDAPSNADLAQMLKAIRSGLLNRFPATGTPDAIAIAPSPAYVALVEGMRFRVKIPGTGSNTSTTPTLAINSLSASIKRRDGSAVAATDLPAGLVLDFEIDAALNARITGAVFSDTASAIAVTGAIPLGQTKILDAIGSGTFTVPAGVYLLRRVRGWAGGGGGGGANSTSAAGAGGGAGAYWEGAIPVTPGQQIAYNIGSGGTGGSAAPGIGGTGGTTTFGSFFTCPGGTGGGPSGGGVSVNPGSGALATQSASLNGFIGPIAGAGIGFPIGSSYGGGFGGPAYGVSNPGPNVGAGGINGIYPGSGGNGSSANAAGGKGANGLIIIDM